MPYGFSQEQWNRIDINTQRNIISSQGGSATNPSKPKTAPKLYNPYDPSDATYNPPTTAPKPKPAAPKPAAPAAPIASTPANSYDPQTGTDVYNGITSQKVLLSDVLGSATPVIGDDASKTPGLDTTFDMEKYINDLAMETDPEYNENLEQVSPEEMEKEIF